MREEELKKVLNELAARTAESVRPGLAEDIKHHIPQQLSPHKGRMDTINIMIDLRVSKLTTAAVIIITMVLCVNFFGGRYSTGEGIFQDSKMLVRYFLPGTGKSDVLASTSKFHEYLIRQDKDVIYYGDSIDIKDSDAILMQWKIDGKYGVMFGDLRTKTVSAEELIKLQARMLQKKTK